jgi:hypothetical protein
VNDNILYDNLESRIKQYLIESFRHPFQRAVEKNLCVPSYLP